MRVEMAEASDYLLHQLWTKAVGTKDYDKREWKLLEDRMTLTNQHIIEYARSLSADEIKELSGELMDIWQEKEFGEEWASNGKCNT